MLFLMVLFVVTVVSAHLVFALINNAWVIAVKCLDGVMNLRSMVLLAPRVDAIKVFALNPHLLLFPIWLIISNVLKVLKVLVVLVVLVVLMVLMVLVTCLLLLLLLLVVPFLILLILLNVLCSNLILNIILNNQCMLLNILNISNL